MSNVSEEETSPENDVEVEIEKGDSNLGRLRRKWQLASARKAMLKDTLCLGVVSGVTIGFSARIKTWSSAPNIWPSTRESGSDNEEKGTGVEASRLRRNPRLLFVSAVNVEDQVGRATFGLVEEGRAESLSEDVNLEDDDVTWDSKKA
jgi:hypothetical protein